MATINDLFTFTGQTAQRRLAGYTAIVIFFLGWIWYFDRENRINDLKEALTTVRGDNVKKDKVIAKKDSIIQVKDEKYNNLIEKIYYRNDSIIKQNEAFINRYSQ